MPKRHARDVGRKRGSIGALRVRKIQDARRACPRGRPASALVDCEGSPPAHSVRDEM